jgi:hypothetical protein
MDHIYPLKQLEVIGCKEVPVLAPAMPRLLSPIFAVYDSDKVLFPPYTLSNEAVIYPDLSNRAEFEELVTCKEVSAFGPVRAEPEYNLWLDDTGEFYYAPIQSVLKNLDLIFKTRCAKAESSLIGRKFATTRLHAMVAYSANPHSVDPLIYRAAAEQMMVLDGSYSDRIKTELVLTETLAESHLAIPLFKKRYLDLIDDCIHHKENLSDSNTTTRCP